MIDFSTFKSINKSKEEKEENKILRNKKHYVKQKERKSIEDFRANRFELLRNEFGRYYVIQNEQLYYLDLRDDDIQNSDFLYTNTKNQYYESYKILRNHQRKLSSTQYFHIIKPNLWVKGEIKNNRFYININDLNEINDDIYYEKDINNIYINRAAILGITLEEFTDEYLRKKEQENVKNNKSKRKNFKKLY